MRKRIEIQDKGVKLIVPGIDGYYTRTTRPGNWVHIHYLVPDDDGIGAKTRKKIGSVSLGNFGEGGVRPCKNKLFREQVYEVIRSHAESIADAE